MRTIFALFEGYREAKRAVEELISRDFDEQELNLIVQELTARANMEADRKTANIDKNERLGERSLRGIDGILAGRHPYRVPDAGDVYAAGKMATIVAKAATDRQSSTGSLKEALVDLDVPDQVAGLYAEGVSDGGVLLWMRTEDERATELANVLSETKAEKVANYS